MPELFIELFSEEIPARMQRRGAEDLARLVGDALAVLKPRGFRIFYGPRRIALAADLESDIPATHATERGPRVNAAEQALAGFLRKHGAPRDQLRREGDFWVLDKSTEARSAASLVAQAMPPLLRRFPWPKSMRWGGASQFAWVRPLRRIICLLGGEVVPFDLREGDDDGHGLYADKVTEGHRFRAPGAFPVSSCAEWEKQLRVRWVLANAEERKQVIADGIADEAGKRGLRLVEDPGLLDEVAGLVEWPVPLIGQIDPRFMDLPPEVMQVSMRANQRYFALSGPDGAGAPCFAFIAGIEAEDGGAVITAGNERVLKARFADARHFWDTDRRTPLAARVPQLDSMTFHAKLGSQGERVKRLESLAVILAPLVGADPVLAERAAFLAKADLVTGMVGEFPDLQGTIGGYYALHDGEDPQVADAIRDHYLPKGAADPVPIPPVSIAIALADRIDQLAAFFAIGEKPTGSGDPYALRRAALGVIRIIRDHRLRLHLRQLFYDAGDSVERSIIKTRIGRLVEVERELEKLHVSADPGIEGSVIADPALRVRTEEILAFLAERLRVQLRSEGKRYDVLAAVFAAGADDDLVRLLARTDAVASFLQTEDGANLLVAYRRAANIIRIEERKDGPYSAEADPVLLVQDEEKVLAALLDEIAPVIAEQLAAEHFTAAMSAMAILRGPLDAFFDRVTVNVPEPERRRNRLCLLVQVRSVMDQVADFSKIEG
ncbi:MAG: glycine--tRNA ligase subunit beta [Acetobacteraceae bacterium]|nr:glycine--tRNA ligase subunit beta [Acetobacteraceae bacterium]